MKIYVDEMPKCCAECDRFCLDEKGRFRCILNSMPDYRSQEEKETARRNDCPLNLLVTCPQLAEKEKQVKVYAHEIAFLDNKLEKKEKEIEILEEQLKNAIVPKFKVGDKVYGIIDTWAYTDVLPIEIRDTHLLYEVWDGEDTTKQHSTRVFATKEEAEQKLNELKGE